MRGLIVLSAFLLLLTGTGCGSDDPSNVDFTQTRVLGQARVPSSGVTGSTTVPLANAPVTVVDRLRTLGQVSRTQDERLQRNVDAGTTDANGIYDVTVDPQEVIAIVVSGTVNGNSTRISGLVNPTVAALSKDFDGTTDVACEAAISAITDGAIPAETVDANFIDTLEAEAANFLANNEVNFFDPASVSAAAAAVRNSVGVGSQPAAVIVDDTSTDELPVCEQSFLGCASTGAEPTCALCECNDGFVLDCSSTCFDTGSLPTICHEDESCPADEPLICLPFGGETNCTPVCDGN